MRRLILLFITVLFISCADDSNTYKLEGNAKGFADGYNIMVYRMVDNNPPVVIDTLTVKNEKFSGRYEKSDEVAINYLTMTDPAGSIVYFTENEDLRVDLLKDSVNTSRVVGGAMNAAYNDFSAVLRKYAALKQEKAAGYQQARQQQDNVLALQFRRENSELITEETAFKVNFAKSNGNSLFAAMLTSDMLNRNQITPATATEIMNGFSPKINSTRTVAKIKSTLAQLKKAEVGNPAPEFSAPTPEGDMLSLKDAMGKYTFVDFWASWCKPCRVENPNIVEVYNKYHDKGLNIISVSLDRTGQKDRWIKAIEDDKMDWYHVSNLKFWQDPIAKAYNVKAIPASFLLDEEGNIIAKNLRGQALHTRMAALFGD